MASITKLGSDQLMEDERAVVWVESSHQDGMFSKLDLPLSILTKAKPWHHKLHMLSNAVLYSRWHTVVNNMTYSPTIYDDSSHQPSSQARIVTICTAPFAKIVLEHAVALASSYFIPQ